MAKSYLSLKHSESVATASAAQIYAAYITAGRATEGDESKWMKRAIREAIIIAQSMDEAVTSDDEMS
ncbi:MAG: hypothetical protein ABGZ17_10205 [Planctomycetaceae bacterium]